jgi:anti-sigma factor (TIGR02949 family)
MPSTPGFARQPREVAMPDETRSIDCGMAIRKLWDYLDEELDDQRMAALREHLDECSACLPHAEFGQKFLAALNQVRARHLMPQEARAQVMAALASAGYSGG